jgi:DNA-binding protein H-NS
MGTTVTLDKRHFKAAAARARELGKTPETFIESLIDAATLTLDEVLAPVRKSFAKSGVTEDELDEAVTEARKAIHARSRRKSRK